MFDKAKQLLTSNKVLTHYDPELPVVVQVDGSPYGLGAVKSNIMLNGLENLVLFLSDSLTRSEIN